MSELAWTSERPMVPGWYWLQRAHLDRQLPPEVVEISTGHEDDYVNFTGCDESYFLRDCIGLWSGPLTPPPLEDSPK